MEVNFGFEASANQETGRHINARLQAISNDMEEESKGAASTTTKGSSDDSSNQTPGDTPGETPSSDGSNSLLADEDSEATRI